MPRKGRRTLEVRATSWSDEPVVMREPSIAAYMAVRDIEDDQMRAIKLLAEAVLDEEGNPVGEQAILDAGVSALGELVPHLKKLLGAGDGEDPGPLAPKTS